MENFAKELQALLIKYNAVIITSDKDLKIRVNNEDLKLCQHS